MNKLYTHNLTRQYGNGHGSTYQQATKTVADYESEIRGLEKEIEIAKAKLQKSKKVKRNENRHTNIYTSEFDGHITDISNCKYHGWTTSSEVNKYFKKIIPFVLPEKWFCLVTKENHEILDKWRLSVARTYKAHGIDIGTPVLSMHPDDGSNFFSYSLKEMLTKSQFKGYVEITTEQFINYVLKLEPAPKMKERKISPTQAQSIVDIACPSWKQNLAAIWARDIVLGLEININEEFYKEMRKACTAPQHELFDKIFGKDVEVYTKGTPCLVRHFSNNSWCLAYADGNGMFYHDSKNKGNVRVYTYHMKLDVNKLSNE